MGFTAFDHSDCSLESLRAAFFLALRLLTLKTIVVTKHTAQIENVAAMNHALARSRLG